MRKLNYKQNNFEYLAAIFNKWIKKSNNLEKRAMLVALAHPPMLNKERGIIFLKFLKK